MKIAILTVSHRDADKTWTGAAPALGTAVQSLLSGFRYFPEHEIHVLMAMRRNVRPSRREGNLVYHDVPVPSWGMLKSAYAGAVLSFRRYLAKLCPDVVHGQGTERECALAASFSGFPRVITIHGNVRLIARVFRSKPFSHMWCAARLEEFALPRANGVICISDYTRRAVEDLAKRAWLVPNAVDESFFSVKRTPGPATVLCVGNVDARKSQNEFIEALVPLAKLRTLRVVFLGHCSDDKYGKRFRRLVSEHPWCEYDGLVPHERLLNYMSQASLLVLPTQEDNCPMVVIEAMAAALPVIASRVGGIPELIQDGATGSLHDPDNMESFRHKIAEWLDQPGVAAHVAEKARQEAERRFHPREVAREHIRIYCDLLKNSTLR
jgi:glycosyltransferase involved in cell wall biosynthesis